jgi:hypothetical protein
MAKHPKPPARDPRFTAAVDPVIAAAHAADEAAIASWPDPTPAPAPGPTGEIVGDTLTIRYADAAHYSARCSADVEAIRAAHPIASAEVTHAPDGTHHVTIRLARV